MNNQVSLMPETIQQPLSEEDANFRRNAKQSLKAVEKVLIALGDHTSQSRQSGHSDHGKHASSSSRRNWGPSYEKLKEELMKV